MKRGLSIAIIVPRRVVKISFGESATDSCRARIRDRTGQRLGLINFTLAYRVTAARKEESVKQKINLVWPTIYINIGAQPTGVSITQW